LHTITIYDTIILMNVGYARVSTHDQTINLQEDALKKAGCEKIFNDVMSGAKSDRPGLLQAVEYARSGDTLVVWKLDRLGRSLKQLIETVSNLNSRGVQIKSLQESIDTNTPNGKFFFHVFGALAEFEKDIIRERTLAGLASARARGKCGGRPSKLTKEQIQQLKALHKDPNNKIADLLKTFNIKKPTLYRYLKM